MGSNTQPASLPFKTAIVTGACSGIGLALTRHLLSLSPPTYRWRVILADIRADSYTAISSTLDSTRTLFVPCDVSSWDDNAALFKKAYSWSSDTSSSSGHAAAAGRIDFFAANAGTDDKENTYGHFDLDAEPQRPNLKCVDVNLTSVFYELKLFIHYARKTQRDLAAAAAAVASPLPFHPKLTITASCAGLYKFPQAPQYGATKHALVGFTRSIGPELMALDGIAVNCVMPGFVPSGLAPAGLVDAWPPEFLTPQETVVRAFEELMDDEGRVSGAPASDGAPGVVKTGCAVECSVDRLFYRQPVEFPDEAQRFLVRETEPGGLWTRSYGAKMSRDGQT